MNPTSLTTIPKFFVLGDSHTKFTPPFTSTPTHQVFVESVSGLQWINNDNRQVSAIHRLSSFSISSTLASSSAVMFIIGSNSLRMHRAATVLHHLETVLTHLRTQHSQFRSIHSIIIVRTFPCQKTSFSFPSVESLQHIIDQYNHQLTLLSEHLNITVLDFHITPSHLSHDRLHIHRDFINLIPTTILHHFHTLSSSISIQTPTKNHRSRAALQIRNHRRHERRAQQQAILVLTRRVSPEWTINHVKTYLKQHNIICPKISPIRNQQLRLRFNTSSSLDHAAALLPDDIFSAALFSTVCL